MLFANDADRLAATTSVCENAVFIKSDKRGLPVSISSLGMEALPETIEGQDKGLKQFLPGAG